MICEFLQSGWIWILVVLVGMVTLGKAILSDRYGTGPGESDGV